MLPHVMCHLSPVTCNMSKTRHSLNHHLTINRDSEVTRLQKLRKINLSPVTCRISPVTCHLSHVTFYMSHVTCHLSPVTSHLTTTRHSKLTSTPKTSHTCHLSHVTCYMSPVTCHLSPFTFYLSPVTCHLSPVTCPCHINTNRHSEFTITLKTYDVLGKHSCQVMW